MLVCFFHRVPCVWSGVLVRIWHRARSLRSRTSWRWATSLLSSRPSGRWLARAGGGVCLLVRSLTLLSTAVGEFWKLLYRWSNVTLTSGVRLQRFLCVGSFRQSRFVASEPGRLSFCDRVASSGARLLGSCLAEAGRCGDALGCWWLAACCVMFVPNYGKREAAAVPLSWWRACRVTCVASRPDFDVERYDFLSALCGVVWVLLAAAKLRVEDRPWWAASPRARLVGRCRRMVPT